jgi:hypothetical protein
VQQLREAFPDPCRYRYVILDQDQKFDQEVLDFLRSTGLKAKRTSVRAPWQNGLAERWIRSCRREILDHVIALNEVHLRRILRDYVNYHEEESPPRRAGEGHAEPVPGGTTAWGECGSEVDGAAGRPAPSVHLAAGGISNPPCSWQLPEIASRNRRNLHLRHHRRRRRGDARAGSDRSLGDANIRRVRRDSRPPDGHLRLSTNGAKR